MCNGNPLALKFTLNADLGAGSGNPSATLTDLKLDIQFTFLILRLDMV